MPKQISTTNIIEALLDGYTHAQQEYESMSGGYWLWQAPEYYITTIISQKLHQLDGAKYITLEHGSKNTLEEAGAIGKGKLPSNITERGRVDILLWWGNATPRAIIEVKNQFFSNEQLEKDIKRLKASLLRKNGSSSLQFGIFSFYQSAADGDRKTAQQKIADRINKTYTNCLSFLGEGFQVSLHTSELNQELENNAWQAACILMKVKSR